MEEHRMNCSVLQRVWKNIFPHSMAKAVVNAAKEKNLDHEEMHSKVEYVVAHGISTTIDDKKCNYRKLSFCI